jgi:hypothetical protein
MPAWAGQAALPAGVPDMSDPKVQARFQEVGMGNLRGNPDFPMLLLLNTAGDQSQAFLFVVDARNGKATWSLTTDPIILIVGFSDQKAIQAVYVDAGFIALGKASGNYAAVDTRNVAALAALFELLTAAARRTHI